MFKTVIAAMAMILAATAPALAKRVALVIGNGAYDHTVPLPNPANDAAAMAGKLRGLGFDVVSGQDQTYDQMRRTVKEFATKAYGAEIALLFYAGHGMQVGGQNLLIPVDAKIEDETSLDFETISVDFILRQMSKDVKVQMVFLDACRDNPLSRTLARRMGPSRSAAVGSGLAEIKIEETGGEGSVIAFATSPGDVALDGGGSNSPFTAALIRHIDTPNASIQTVMTRVTGDVYNETDKLQRPWVNASLIGEVFLNKQVKAEPQQQVAALGSASTDTQNSQARTNDTEAAANSKAIDWEREKLIWDTAKETDTIDGYVTYHASYPNGAFADFAKSSIKRLLESEAKETQTASRTPETTPKTTPAPEPAQAAAPTGAGTPQTEATLGWNRSSRREVQTRLNLAGHSVGRPDGAFGPRTRAGISAWQSANSFAPTGYFTPNQYAALVTQTAPQFAIFVEQMRRQRPPVATRSATQRAPKAQHQTQQANPPSGAGQAGAAFLGGVVGGILGGALGN